MNPLAISPAYAQQAGAPAGDFSFLIIMVGMLAIFYFLLWRPQRKRQKEHEELVKNLRRGDRVVTAGGLVGTVTRATDEDEVEVEIASGVRVRVVRALVSSVKAKPEPVKSDKSEKKTKGRKQRDPAKDAAESDAAETEADPEAAKVEAAQEAEMKEAENPAAQTTADADAATPTDPDKKAS